MCGGWELYVTRTKLGEGLGLQLDQRNLRHAIKKGWDECSWSGADTNPILVPAPPKSLSSKLSGSPDILTEIFPRSRRWMSRIYRAIRKR